MRDLAELERLFAETNDFSGFWNHFLDDWAMQPWFMKQGAPTETTEMEMVVARIAGNRYGRPVKPKGMRLFRIEGAGVVHGAFIVDGKLGGVVYFENIEKGLIVAPGAGTLVHYARFTWQFGGGSEFIEIPRDPGDTGLPN